MVKKIESKGCKFSIFIFWGCITFECYLYFWGRLLTLLLCCYGTRAKFTQRWNQTRSQVWRNNNLCQSILDPSSINLSKGIFLCDPELDKMLRISRDYCHAINSARIRILARKKIWTDCKILQNSPWHHSFKRSVLSKCITMGKIR